MNQQLTYKTEEALTWRRKLNELRYNCGCKAGMFALILSVVICSCYFKYSESINFGNAKKILITCVIAFISALVGKGMGMLWTRYKYEILKKKLLKQGIIEIK